MGLAEQIFGICRNRSRLEMYDVNFGGIERMTKRLTIALVALAMFVLVAVMPVSATLSADGNYYVVAPNINAGRNSVYRRTGPQCSANALPGSC